MSQTLEALKRIESRRCERQASPEGKMANEMPKTAAAAPRSKPNVAALPSKPAAVAPQAKPPVAAVPPKPEPVAVCPASDAVLRADAKRFEPQPTPAVAVLPSPQPCEEFAENVMAITPEIVASHWTNVIVVESTNIESANIEPANVEPANVGSANVAAAETHVAADLYECVPLLQKSSADADSLPGTACRQAVAHAPKERRTIRWPYQPATGVQYEKLATSFLAQPMLQQPAAVMFTSPGDGDGKSNLLVALAPLIAAWAERDTLLIDADFYNSDISSRLAVFNDGLIGLIAGRSTMHEVVCSTTMPHLTVLPQGSPSMSEHGLHDLPALKAVLDDLKRRYPLVLLDASSLSYPLVAAMGWCCDGVCLVVRPGHTSRRAVGKATRLISAGGGHLLGCVVIGE